jgi:hypothetical protein
MTAWHGYLDPLARLLAGAECETRFASIRTLRSDRSDLSTRDRNELGIASPDAALGSTVSRLG